RMWGAYGHVPDDSAPRDRRYDPPLQQFNLLHGMTISRDGTVYVADRNANRVQSFTLDGKFLKEGWVSRSSPQGDFGTAFAVALSGDKAQRFLYVADGITSASRCWTVRLCSRFPARKSAIRGPIRGSFSTSM